MLPETNYYVNHLNKEIQSAHEKWVLLARALLFLEEASGKNQNACL